MTQFHTMPHYYAVHTIPLTRSSNTMDIMLALLPTKVFFAAHLPVQGQCEITANHYILKDKLIAKL